MRIVFNVLPRIAQGPTSKPSGKKKKVNYKKTDFQNISAKFNSFQFVYGPRNQQYNIGKLKTFKELVRVKLNHRIRTVPIN